MPRYEVMTPTTAIEVVAQKVTVGNNGDLVLASGDLVNYAFAAGQWLDVSYVG